MTHELISTTCISAGDGLFVSSVPLRSSPAASERETPSRGEMEQVIAWRIDTFRIAGEDVPFSTTWPVTINGSIDSAEFVILRPDGTLEHPEGASFRFAKSSLHLVHGHSQ